MANEMTLEEKCAKAAKMFIKRKGYEIIQEGFEFPGFNVDLVAIDNSDLVFIQVKTKKDGDEITEHGITTEERRSFVNMMLAYVDQHDEYLGKIRLDIISIFPRGNKAIIQHHINASSETVTA